MPVSSCGLYLSDEEVRIAVGLRIGLPLVLPHACEYGGMIDSLGLHCLACIKSANKQARQSIINDVVYRSMVSAKIQAVKEPTGLCKDGKRPDSASIIPWKRGKIVTWDVTVADSFAASYIKDTSFTAGAASELAAMTKTAKYEELTRTYLFVPLACEVTGVWNAEAEEFFNCLGSRISGATGDARETTFLYQRLSIALQRGTPLALANLYIILTGWSNVVWVLVLLYSPIFKRSQERSTGG